MNMTIQVIKRILVLLIPLLQNPKKRRGKGRPLGIKRFKSSCKVYNTEKLDIIEEL